MTNSTIELCTSAIITIDIWMIHGDGVFFLASIKSRENLSYDFTALSILSISQCLINNNCFHYQLAVTFITFCNVYMSRTEA